MLTVVSSYRNRLNHLKEFCKSVKGVNEAVKFIVVFLGDKEQEAIKVCFDADIEVIYKDYHGAFNTAMAHNIGFNAADTEWVMKQDIDCLAPSPDFYDYILKEIGKCKDYLIVGVNGHVTGNEFVVRKKDWLAVGRCPEFDGLGWEDYAFEYKLHKYFHPDFQVSSIEFVTNCIRDEIVKVKNNELSMRLKHIPHQKKKVINPKNLVLLKNIVQDVMRYVDINICIPSCKGVYELKDMVTDIEKAGSKNIVIHCEKESAAYNRNRVYEECKKEYIVMIDDDISGFYPGWEYDLIKPLEREDIGIVSARLITKTGENAPQLGVIKRNTYTDIEFAVWRTGFNEINAVCSAAIAFRKKDVDGIINRLNKPFDEMYTGSGYEDVDFCMLFKEVHPGKHIVINNKCLLIHGNEMKNQGNPKNKEYFEKKWQMR